MVVAATSAVVSTPSWALASSWSSWLEQWQSNNDPLRLNNKTSFQYCVWILRALTQWLLLWNTLLLIFLIMHFLPSLKVRRRYKQITNCAKERTTRKPNKKKIEKERKKTSNNKKLRGPHLSNHNRETKEKGKCRRKAVIRNSTHIQSTKREPGNKKIILLLLLHLLLLLLSPSSLLEQLFNNYVKYLI